MRQICGVLKQTANHTSGAKILVVEDSSAMRARMVSELAELGGIEEMPGGPRHAGFEAMTQIRRQDFGLIPAVPAAMLGDVIKVEIDIELLEP